jgi:hypothetical protein
MLDVADLTDCSLAVDSDVTNFTGGESNLSHIAFLSHELSHSSGRTNKLSTLTGDELDAVDECTNGNVGDGQAVTGLDICVCTGVKNVTVCYANGSCDVALLTVLVLKEGDVSGSVGVILNTDNGLRAVIKTLEVDESVLLLVTAAMMTNGDTTVAVTAGVLLLSSEKALFRAELGYFLEGGHGHISSRRCSRLILNSRHLLSPPS